MDFSALARSASGALFGGGGDDQGGEGEGGLLSWMTVLPISLFEPTTNLTRAAERFAHPGGEGALLRAADAAALAGACATRPGVLPATVCNTLNPTGNRHFDSDSAARTRAGDNANAAALVAAWAVSAAGAQRAAKPFNPVLGETHEQLIRRAAGGDGLVYVMCEQVSHQPAVSALFAECDDFLYTATHRPATSVSMSAVRVHANSLERVTLRRSGRTFELRGPDHEVVNALAKLVGAAGAMHVNAVGELNVVCQSTGARASVTFTPQHERSTSGELANLLLGCAASNGVIKDGGTGAGRVQGHAWAHGGAWPDAPELALSGVVGKRFEARPVGEGEGRDSTRVLWEHAEAQVEDATTLQDDEHAEEEGVLRREFSLPATVRHQLLWQRAFAGVLLSDSRLRPDRAALAAGDAAAAAAAKGALEERQREERRRREQSDDPRWRPRWFKPALPGGSDAGDGTSPQASALAPMRSSGDTPPTELAWDDGALAEAWDPLPALLDRAASLRAEHREAPPAAPAGPKPTFAPW